MQTENETREQLEEARDRLGGQLTAIMDGSEPATPDSEANTRAALARVEDQLAALPHEYERGGHGRASLCAVCFRGRDAHA